VFYERNASFYSVTAADDNVILAPTVITDQAMYVVPREIRSWLKTYMYIYTNISIVSILHIVTLSQKVLISILQSYLPEYSEFCSIILAKRPSRA
jgi:hypothetical protein